jgi:glycosyltransferase involved in cell wall biosynthesis
MRVLFLSRHDSQVASCRHRVLQFLPYFESAGIECVVSPFFDNGYARRYERSGRKSPLGGLRGLVRRLRMLRSVDSFDLVFAQAEVFPFLPAAAEAWLARGKVPLVLDYDDAVFHKYDRHPSRVVRTLLGPKIARLMRMARLVIAGNDYLAEYARRQGAEVTVVPTTVDLARYPLSPSVRSAPMFTLGWIGSPSTTPHLEHALLELRAAAQAHPFKLVAIGARPFDAGDLPVERIPWSEGTEIVELNRCDAGIMPLPDTPWTRGKCGFKLIQAMACWKPVIASPVGANVAIVNEACGILAGDGQWRAAIERLRGDSDLRARMGVAARARVAERYSLQAWAPRVVSILRGVAERLRHDA